LQGVITAGQDLAQRLDANLARAAVQVFAD
jgi:hypothetical protein